MPVAAFSLSQLWDLGAAGETDPGRLRSLRVSNQLAVLMVLVSVPFLTVLGSAPVAAVTLTISLPLYLVTLLFNHRGYLLAARLWLVLVSAVAVSLTLCLADDSVVARYAIGDQILMLCLLLLPLTLFELAEREALGSTLGILVLLYFFFPHLDARVNIGRGLSADFANSDPVLWLTSAVTILLIVLSVVYFKRATEFHSRASQDLAISLQQRAEALDATERDLRQQTANFLHAQQQLEAANLALNESKLAVLEQQLNLKQTEQRLAAREELLLSQQAEDQLLARYSRLSREYLGLPLPQAMELFLQSLAEEYPIWQAVLFLESPISRQLVAVASLGVSVHRLREINAAPPQNLVSFQASLRKPLFLDRLPQETLVVDPGVFTLRARSLGIVPLVAGHRSVGVLEVAFGERLNTARQQVLCRLLENLAIVLQGLVAQYNFSELLTVVPTVPEAEVPFVSHGPRTPL